MCNSCRKSSTASDHETVSLAQDAQGASPPLRCLVTSSVSCGHYGRWAGALWSLCKVPKWIDHCPMTT
jgi:hypothetical protein